MLDLGPFPESQGLVAIAPTSVPITPPSFAITAEGTVTSNGNSDFDGVATDFSDDAFIHGGRGFTFNGNPELPVQRDAQGNPIRDRSGKLILLNQAVTVAAEFTTANGPSNTYAGLIPPQVVPRQTVTVPSYSTLRTQVLTVAVPARTPEIVFDANRTPRNARDWATQFPASGIATQPTVVRVINGGLVIPSNVVLSHMVITVETGDINFNGSGHDFNDVVLIANNGNINLANVSATDLVALASGTINMNGGARFGGGSLLANDNRGGSITFNGATKTINTGDLVRIVSQGGLTFNGASATRGLFLSVGNTIFNGQSTLYGAVGSKGNITFNGNTKVFGVRPLPPSNLQLSNTTVAENVEQGSQVGIFTADNIGSSAVYSLVAGTGDVDNGSFRIQGDRLLLQVSPDFETKSSYSIRVRVTNAAELMLDRVFTITVEDVDENQPHRLSA